MILTINSKEYLQKKEIYSASQFVLSGLDDLLPLIYEMSIMV